MSIQTTTAASTLNKKDARKDIYKKLENALNEYRDQFREKRFEAKLKKASRLFADDLGKRIKKNKDKSKKKKNKLGAEIVNATNGTI